MTLEDFIAEFRLVRGDTVLPYLWSDEEITSHLNDAVNEACERALLIEDKTTSAVCTLSLEVGTASYALHDSVVKVKRVVLGGKPLTETSVEKMDASDPFWESREGDPSEYLLEGSTGIRFDTIPTTAADASLTVYRTPLVPLSTADMTAEPEIKSLYHKRLLPWVYRCALLKHDAETYDKERADVQEAIFTRSFGERPDANVQRKRRDKRPPVVSVIW